jgi:integrase
VGEYLTRWLQDTARLTVRDRTHRNYTQNLTKYVIPIVGGIKLDRLAPAHVQAISANMEAQGKSPRTRQLVHSILRRALSQAVKWGMLPRNVCDSVERPRVPRHEMQALCWKRSRRTGWRRCTFSP